MTRYGALKRLVVSRASKCLQNSKILAMALSSKYSSLRTSTEEPLSYETSDLCTCMLIQQTREQSDAGGNSRLGRCTAVRDIPTKGVSHGRGASETGDKSWYIVEWETADSRGRRSRHGRN